MQDLFVGDRHIYVVGRAGDCLLSQDCSVQYLEHVEASAGGGAVGAEADAYAAAHHLQHAWGAHAVVVEGTVAGGNITLRVEVYLAVAEQDGVRGVNVVIEGMG